jgi:cell division protein FtsZ
MEDAGPALIGMGRGSGENRAADAARQAIASPLLEASFEGARGILFNVSGPPDLRLGEVRLAADQIREHAGDDANIVFGASFSESLGEDVLVTLIATGLNGNGNGHAPATEAEASSGAPAAQSAAEKRPRKRPPPKATPPPSSEPVTPTAEVAGEGQPAPPAATEEPSTPSPTASDEAGPEPTLEDDELDVPSFLRRGR